MALKLDDLDPGIRETVRRLNEAGFVTSDSGDGVSKIGGPMDHDGEVRREPHVIIPTPNPVTIADRLWAWLTGQGIRVDPVGQGDVFVQASYDPADGTGIVELIGLDDAGWPDDPT